MRNNTGTKSTFGNNAVAKRGTEHSPRSGVGLAASLLAVVLAFSPFLSSAQLVKETTFNLDFSKSEERQFIDLPLISHIPPGATSVALSLALSETPASLVRGFSLHFQSGSGWYSYSLSPVAPGDINISIPLSRFTPEDSPKSLHQAGSFRVSAWRNTAVPAGKGSVTVRSLAARADTVAIIRATAYTAPGDAWAAAPADRCGRILDRAGVPYAMIPDTSTSFSDFKLVFLPYAPKPPAEFLKRLSQCTSSSWLSHKSGKLVVFYNPSQALAKNLGFSVAPWQGADDGHGWTAISANGVRIPYPTTNILPPVPVDSSSKTLATWVDEGGRETSIPAVCISPRGAWFSHVPPLPSHSAGAFFRSLVSTLCPDIPLMDPVKPAPVTAKLSGGASSEVRGVWEPRGNARTSAQWQTLFDQLHSFGVNALFIHWQSAGTAHYRTEPPDVRPFSLRVKPQLPNPVADALRANSAKADGAVAIHAWATCFTLEGCAAGQRTELMNGHQLLANSEGIPWMDPGNQENRNLIIAGFLDLIRRGVTGIHMDYVRYPVRAANDKEQAAHCAAITAFVRGASTAIRMVAPKAILSCAVYPTPADARAMGQDWPAWVKEGLVDFVCPMVYTESAAAFKASLEQALAAGVPPAAIVAGIGTGADESQLDAAGASAQIAVCRELNLRGFAFFAADEELLGKTLPALK